MEIEILEIRFSQTMFNLVNPTFKMLDCASVQITVLSVKHCKRKRLFLSDYICELI